MESSERPLVSIIVRTKDRPQLLKRALTSIAAQTYRPIEVVLVNDGGCDLDPQELRNVLGDISLNYVRLENNTGRAHAGNVGIEHAKGNYIGFLDDDDTLYPEHVDTLVTFLDQSDYEVAYTDTEMIFEEVASEEGGAGEVKKKIFSKDFSYADLLVGNYIPFNSVLFSEHVLRAAGKIDESLELYEDWDLLIRIGENHPFYHIEKLTALYNQWNEDLQINRANAEYMMAMHIKVIKKYCDRITPEMILNMKHEKERLEGELKGIMDSLGDSGDLLKKMSEQLRKANREKERQGREKERQILQLQELLRSKDNHTTRLEDTLKAMRNTIGWKALEKLRRIREKTLPQDSGRRKLYDLGIKSIKTFNEEGPVKFFEKIESKLRYSARTQGELFKKANSVLRIHGFRTFLKYAYQYLFHGKGSFKAMNAYSQDVYEQWIERNEKRDERKIREDIERFGYTPMISVITPVFNIDPKWLNRCIESVVNQLYENWELCIHDDASTNKETLSCLQQWITRDKRIKITFGKVNLGISGASNEALKSATGEFVALLDNDDELSPDALFENVRLLNGVPDTDLIYSDEDRIVETDRDEARRYDPFFKPDWSPQLLFASMYTGHLSVYRKSLVDEVGGFRSEFDFSQDYDLALRVTEKTNRIKHIQKILYHWRAIPGSAAAEGKHFARRSNIRALESAVQRRGYDAEVIEYPFANRVKFNLRIYPLVSVIIPTDNKKNIVNCIELLFENTSYPNFEIIVVTNSQLGEDIMVRYYGEHRVRIHAFDKPFNFSLKCNEGASVAKGEYLLFLNDDVEAIEDTWLEAMVGVFGKGNVGGVSPKLFYENDAIQYAGMVTGVRGLAGTAFHGQPKDSTMYFNLIQSERNVLLLSGACLLIPRDIFHEVGGFDTANTPIMHSDFEVCFKVLEKGYELIYTPFASLRHIGHLSLREMEPPEIMRKKDNVDIYIIKRWGDYLSSDPFYPNCMKEFLYQDGHLKYELIANRQESLLSAKNILLITHDLSLSGAPLLLHWLACHLRGQGYFVMVISPVDGQLTESYRKENIPVMIDCTIADNLHRETKNLISQFDLILVNTMVMWRSVLIANEINIPVIWFIHESLFGLDLVKKNRKIEEAFSLANRVSFIGESTASLYQKYNTRGNFAVVNYGARALDRVQEKIRGNGKFAILNVGSIEPRKGQDVLIKAILNLPKRCLSDIEVYLIGRVLQADFHEEVKKLSGNNENIYFIGEVSRDQVAEFMKRADIFICSSRDEVGPLTVLEAMSCGKTVISTDVGGVSAMIRNREDGIIIPNEDSKALSESILYLYDNRQELKRLGENAYKRFYEKFTMEIFGDKLLDIIKDELNSTRTKGIASSVLPEESLRLINK